MAIPGSPSSIETARTVEYRNAVGFQLAETPGKVGPVLCGSRGDYAGSKKAQIEDRFDDLVATEINERLGDTQHTDADIERRWIIKPKPQRVSPLIDRDDSKTIKLDAKSALTIQTAKAIRRAQGDRFLQGFYGNAYTGEEGTTAVPFAAANIVAVNQDEGASNKGITKNKLLYLRELMTSKLVDLEEEMPIGIITAKQITDLLKINELVDRDFHNPGLKMALETGKPQTFLGFLWVPSELGNSRVYPQAASLTVDGSGYRRVPFFVKSGMHWGNWEEMFARVTERDDKEFATQIYASTTGAAARVNEDKCYQMLCNEAANR